MDSSTRVMVTLNDETVASMAIAEVFKFESPCHINSMDFFTNGELLVSGSDDGTVSLYDPVEGRQRSKVYCRKYGIANVRFTHHVSAIIGSSNRSCFDFSIRYLSLHDNTYLREYRGHTDSVISIAMSPLDDTFLSGSLDGTVRFWDLRTNICNAVLKKQGHHVVAYDPSGVAFCTASPNNYVKLFDLRSLKDGPFSTFKISHEPFDAVDVLFSDNGKWLAVSSNTNLLFLLDAFSGDVVQKFTSFTNEATCKLGISFSPDSRYISTGSEDGKIHTWHVSAAEGDEVAVWEGHVGPVGCVAWNPKYQMVASACSNTAFWIPNPKKPEVFV